MSREHAPSNDLKPPVRITPPKLTRNPTTRRTLSRKAMSSPEITGDRFAIYCRGGGVKAALRVWSDHLEAFMEKDLDDGEDGNSCGDGWVVLPAAIEQALNKLDETARDRLQRLSDRAESARPNLPSFIVRLRALKAEIDRRICSMDQADGEQTPEQGVANEVESTLAQPTTEEGSETFVPDFKRGRGTKWKPVMQFAWDEGLHEHSSTAEFDGCLEKYRQLHRHKKIAGTGRDLRLALQALVKRQKSK
jgi:hypothetical protein